MTDIAHSSSATTDARDRIAELRRALGPAARPDEALWRHTSLRVGGPADLYYVARTAQQFIDAVDRAVDLGVPWRAIGSASNLLIADDGIEGLVVRAAAVDVQQTEDGGAVLARADAGCMLAALGKQMAIRGLAGLEWAVNVPGTVGASVVNNSGAFGSCVAEHLIRARIHLPGGADGEIEAQDLDLRYRSSLLKRGDMHGIVLDATYRLTPADPAGLRARIAEIQRTRRASQPTGYSVGSVFANPDGDSAGRLIEAAGLKGSRVGSAEVSMLHANFIVNQGGARAQDVLQLIRHVQTVVWQRWGVWLRPEVQLAGRFEAETVQALHAPPGAAA